MVYFAFQSSKRSGWKIHHLVWWLSDPQPQTWFSPGIFQCWHHLLQLLSLTAWYVQPITRSQFYLHIDILQPWNLRNTRLNTATSPKSIHLVTVWGQVCPGNSEAIYVLSLIQLITGSSNPHLLSTKWENGMIVQAPYHFRTPHGHFQDTNHRGHGREPQMWSSRIKSQAFLVFICLQ